jgi:hypothetical protein
MSVKRSDQGLIFQLYVNKDRAASEKLVRSLESRGFRGIMLTVDAAVPGKRELDQRAKGDVGSAVCLHCPHPVSRVDCVRLVGTCSKRIVRKWTGRRACWC